MRKILFLLLITNYSLLIVHAQVTQEWVSRYNGPPGNSSDDGNVLAIDGAGNVYVTGHSVGSTSFGDYATVKYNSAGVQQWAARYNGPGNYFERPYAIAVDGSGNVYVTGRSTGIGTGYDYATIKYNSSGDSVWVRRYNGPGNDNDEARSITVDGSGNVYVTGWSPAGNGLDDYATIKYNSSGDSVWVRRYNGPASSSDEAYSIAVDGSGNVYVTGRSIGSGYDYVTIKYNSSGVQQWVARYNGLGNGYDVALSLAVDGPGNVYVTGGSYGSGTNYDYATIKYNSSGVQQWVQRYNGPGNGDDAAYSIAVDGSGNVYVTGGSYGSGTSYDYATIKYNISGVQQWVQIYNGPGNSLDDAYSLGLDGSGNVYVTGQSMGSGTDRDYATIKYNSVGVQQWVERYNGPGNGGDVARSIALDVSGNVYVTGESAGSGTGLDFATIKYSQQVGIQPISNEIPERFSLSQNYPNPFNPSTVISFQLAVNSFASLKVYDLLGREVSTLVNEKLNSGIYEVDFDGSDFASGVYYYTLTADPETSSGFRETKKMVLLK